MRRRRNPLSNFFVLFIFGTIAGIVFFILDNANNANLPVASTLAPVFTSVPTKMETEATRAATPGGLLAEAELFIPSVGILAPVIQVYLDGESWDVSRLGRNVGHLQGTAWLDEPGNIVLSGHVEMADGSLGIFAGLESLAMGEQIIIRYEDTERRYIIKETKRVEPDDLTPLYPTTTDRLTLITCAGYDFLRDSYLERIVLVAERVN